jgi:hypothetical protein
MKTHTIVTVLLLTALFAPLGSQFVPEPIAEAFDIDQEENEGFFLQKNTPSAELKNDIRTTFQTGARAPCPAFQSDGGTAGDSGNTSNTSKPLGTDPTTSITGCVDSIDTSDWYSFSLTSGKDIDVELSVPAGADFDLYLVNSAGTTALDASEYNDPLERVSSAGTSISGVAGTYYIAIYQYSSDGNYNLETWTNESVNCDNWWNQSQDDGGTGGDAVANWTDNPTNMGSNVTSVYTGCIDGTDRNDVFAFDVPANHTIEVELTMHDNTSDLDIFIHAPNGSVADLGYTLSNPETASTSGGQWDGVNGTYFVNASQWSGVSNYTLKVWTNYSVPGPNLVIDDINVPSGAQQGDSITIDVDINNTGSLDTSEIFNIKLWLSVDYLHINWVDHMIANQTVNGALIDVTQVVSINAVIPNDLIGGAYYLSAKIDTEEVIEEKSESDNTIDPTSQITIGTSQTACPTSQNDAGSGGDAGGNSPGAISLGTDIEQEFRGCLDSSDTTDWYKVTVSSGMPLNATLVSTPGGADYDMDLLTSSGVQVDSSISWWSDDFVSTEETTWNLTSGTYTLIINRSSGDGDYRLFIGEPAQGTWVPPFSCDGASDLSLGQDASDESNNPSIIGTNPMESGTGCVDGSDVVDAYQFTLSEFNNVEISLIQTEGTAFTATLYTQMGSLIEGWEYPSVDEMRWHSLDNTAHEGQDGTYVLIIGSNGTVGNYTLAITTTNPAPADLEPNSFTCLSNITSGESGFASYSITNLRGPLDSFGWDIMLLDESLQSVATLISGTVTDDATYGNIIASGSEIVEIPQNISSGNYYCQFVVDSNNEIVESNESNNEILGQMFYIQNYGELWANDIDQDGYNTTDTGDGIIDECPTTYGESTDPMFGCPDLDGDGWANSIDFNPQDSTQWVDADNDTFGDNPDGTDGDKCPTVAGVADGDDGMGCPKTPVDSDGDGVEDAVDQCANTPAGTVVDTTGCEVVDNSGNNTNNGTNSNNGSGTTTNNGSGTTNNNGNTNNGNDNVDDDSGDVESDNLQSILENPTVLIGVGSAILIIVLLTFFMVGRKGRGSIKDDAFVNAAFSDAAFGGGMATMPGGVLPYDAMMTAEQLQYEQQLVAQGHPPQTARQYGNQYFRQG